MYCTVSTPCPAVFRVHDPQRLCDGRTDGRTDCGRPSVRRRRPSVCPASLSFCSGVVCASVAAAALLSCSAAVFFFPSSCRVSSLPVGVLRLGLKTFSLFPWMWSTCWLAFFRKLFNLVLQIWVLCRLLLCFLFRESVSGAFCVRPFR